MGFALTIAPMSTMVDEFNIKNLHAWLDANKGHVNERVEISSQTSVFPFEPEKYQIDEEDEGSEYVDVVRHVEVGWSWWGMTVNEMTKVLGIKNVKASSFVQPLWGAAVPFEIKNQHLIKQHTPSPLGKFFLFIFTPKDPSGMDIMLMTKNGKSESVRNLRISSASKILCELESACRAWNLPNDETEARTLAEEMYEAMPETDETISRCYALIVRSFLRYAVEQKLIVWFIK